VVFGRYLPSGLVGMKVKGWCNHLHDEMQYLDWILSFGGIMWIAIPTSSFIDIFPCLCGV
jgi:hypothetical protein